METSQTLPAGFMERKQQLVDAALPYFLSRGLVAWTYRGAAGDLGISTNTLNHYFRSRDGLVSVLMEAVKERAVTPWRAMRQAALPLGAGSWVGVFEAISHDDSTGCCLEARVLSRRGDETVREAVEEVRCEAEAAVADQLRDRGVHADRVEPLARLCVAALNGLAALSAGDDHKEIELSVEAVRELENLIAQSRPD